MGQLIIKSVIISDVDLFTTILAPSAPLEPRVVSSDATLPVTITWDPPTQPNGKITAYTIELLEMSRNTTTTITAAGSNTKFNVSTIDTAYKYLFRVGLLSVIITYAFINLATIYFC